MGWERVRPTGFTARIGRALFYRPRSVSKGPAGLSLPVEEAHTYENHV